MDETTAERGGQAAMNPAQQPPDCKAALCPRLTHTDTLTAVEVALEELRDDIERVEVLRVRRPRHDVEDFDDVVVLAKVPGRGRRMQLSARSGGMGKIAPPKDSP